MFSSRLLFFQVEKFFAVDQNERGPFHVSERYNYV